MQLKTAYSHTVGHQRVFFALDRALPQQHHLLSLLERPDLEAAEVDTAGDCSADIVRTVPDRFVMPRVARLVDQRSHEASRDVVDHEGVMPLRAQAELDRRRRIERIGEVLTEAVHGRNLVDRRVV